MSDNSINAFNPSGKSSPNIWRVIGVMLAIGTLMIFFFATISENRIIGDKKLYFYRDVWTVLFNLSMNMLIAGASAGCGGLLGFLFGIPRLVSQNLAPSVSSDATKAKIARAIVSNDNLVQISDWLTKIIVGVGLTQLYNIPHFIRKVGEFLSDSFKSSVDNTGNPIPDAIGRNEAIAVVIYFLITGFIAAYIWTRLAFTKMLNDLELNLDDEGKQIISVNA